MDQAIAHYESALKAQPDYVEALTGLGNAYYAKGDTYHALIEYQKTIELRPDLPEVQNNVGNILLQNGNVTEAISHYQEALKIQPDYVNSLTALAWLLSTADSSIRDGTKAVELAGKANRLSGGEDPRILGTLAAAFAEAGRFPEAMETVGHALRQATTANNTGMINDLNAQLMFYRAGRPLHLSSR
jgi:tetratricopeptide (TPR) repeat protein